MTGKFTLAWWARWLPFAARSVAITEDGVEWCSRAGQHYLHWSDLPEPPRAVPLWFLHSVSLITPSKTFRLHFATRRHRDDVWQQLIRAWYAPHIKQVGDRLEYFQSFLAQQRYIRSSQWSPVLQELNTWRNYLPPVPANDGPLNPVAQGLLQSAWALIHDAEGCLAQARETYIYDALDKYKALFDVIESQPLSAKQRRACVIDEDNNLILAGAGTGKTSTVIGRVAFLVHSGQAKPEEILLLAYGSAAAAEMRERLEKRLGVKGVTADTFHALGRRIVETVEGKKSAISPMATDGALKAKFVDETFKSLLHNDAKYRDLLLTYFKHWLYPVRNPFDFKSMGAYYCFLQDNDVRTLKGEAVKGFGECDIANFLFANGVEYQYEAVFTTPEQSSDRGVYRPDFYLPDYNVYIEHFGTDRAGNTAPYIDRTQYHADMEWKRKVHKLKGTRLIETFHFEKQEAQLLELLQKRLKDEGVVLNPLPPEAVLETLREFGAISKFAEVLAQMLGLFKAANLSGPELLGLAEQSPHPAQVRAALLLLAPLLDAYDLKLKSANDGKGEVDFDDMINRAIVYVDEPGFIAPWKYIVVDEFQDIAKSRAQLVQALRHKCGASSLFCVGDDWQSIYRFAGSDITFTTDFKARFGSTAVSDLDKTYRFNSKIGEVASRFVMRNPRQLVKHIQSHAIATQPTISLLRSSTSSFGVIDEVVERISQVAEPGSSIYFLARFGFDLPGEDALHALERRYPLLTFKGDTIHRSKGKEADYVVLLGLKKGQFGLPSEKVTHPLVDALLPKVDEFSHAEERRLFYVALTRARHRVYLPVDMRSCSPFVLELMSDGYPLELDEFDATGQQRLSKEARCPICEEGALVVRTNKTSKAQFIGCSNYPRCTHTEKCCEKCDAPMTRAGRFKICVNENCNWWIPVCPVSGGDMSYKTGFWGCSHYRSNDPGSCRHTEKRIGDPPVRPSHVPMTRTQATP